MSYCEVCGSCNVELHHIVFKSENKNLQHCELNFIYLCPEHHRGTFGPHGSKGANLNRKLKLEFQNELELRFAKEYLIKEDVQDVLKINEKALLRLLKPIRVQVEGYERESVIRAIMGGKLYGL